jgi:hypothetical protein
MEAVAERGWDVERKCFQRGDITEAVEEARWIAVQRLNEVETNDVAAQRKLEEIQDRKRAAHMSKQREVHMRRRRDGTGKDAIKHHNTKRERK